MQHNNRANILFLREQAEAFGTKIILYTFYRTSFLQRCIVMHIYIGMQKLMV